MRPLMSGLLLCSLLGCGEGLPDRSTQAPEIVTTTPAVADAQLPPADTAEPQPPTPPPDADGDGVVGVTDLCVDSPYGEPVDETGCRPRLAVEQEYTLPLTFETASAKIVGDPRGALAEVAALITQYPETTVVIEGHTDDVGPASFNKKISLARAEAVAKVLVRDLGIDSARVSTQAFGETRPIATNATKEGRERNRRVVAVVLPGKPLTPVTASTAVQ